MLLRGDRRTTIFHRFKQWDTKGWTILLAGVADSFKEHKDSKPYFLTTFVNCLFNHFKAIRDLSYNKFEKSSGKFYLQLETKEKLIISLRT